MTLRFRRVLGWGVRSLAVLAVLMLLALLSVVWLARSDSGRELIRIEALAALRGQFAGQLDVAELSELGWSHFELAGATVRDPSGATVLDIDQLRVRFALPALLAGHIDLPQVSIVGADIDLADLGDARGLLAALAPPPTATSAEGAADDEPGPAVTLRAVALHGLQVEVAVPGRGAMSIRRVEARGRVGLSERLDLRLSSFSAQVFHNGERLADVPRLQGELTALPLESAALDGSRLALDAQLRAGDTELQIDAAGPLSGWDGADVAGGAEGAGAVRASVRVTGLDGELLRRLGQPEAADALIGALAAELEVSGSAAEPRAELRVQVAGRPCLAAQASLDATRAGQLSVTASGLRLGEVVRGVPKTPLSGRLVLRGGLPVDPSPRRVNLQLTEAQYGDVPLPEVTAVAQVSRTELQDLSLQARAYGGLLSLTGSAALSGARRASGHLRLTLDSLAALPHAVRDRAGKPNGHGLELEASLDLRPRQLRAEGQLALSGLRLARARVRAMSGRFALTGDPTAPQLDAVLDAAGVQLGDLALQRGRLRLEGGPDRYRLGLWGRAGEDFLRVQGALAREADGVTAGLRARGRLAGQPARIQVDEARFRRDGSFHVGALEAVLLGAGVRGSGGYAQARFRDLALRVDGLDLALVAPLWPAAPALEGQLAFSVSGRGSVRSPRLALDVEANRLRLDGRTLVERLRLEGALSPAGPAGDVSRAHSASEARLRVEATAGRGLSAKARASLRFAASSAPFRDRIEGADITAAATIDHVTTAYLEALTGTSSPREAVVMGTLSIEGTARAPVVDADLRAQLREVTVGHDAEVSLGVHYAEGAAQAGLRVLDSDGPFLALKARAGHPAANLQALIRDAATLPAALDWELEADLFPRTLSRFPTPLDPLLETVSVHGHATLSHAAAGAPSGSFSLTAELPAEALGRRFARAEAKNTGSPAGSSPSPSSSPGGDPSMAPGRSGPGRARACGGASGEPLELVAEGTLGAGRMGAHAALTRRGDSLADIRAGLALALDDVLAGRGGPQWRDVGVDAVLHDVELSSLPVVCRLARGKLRGVLHGERLTEGAPRVETTLAIRGLSLDHKHAVDVSVAARANARYGQLDVDLVHDDARSRLHARVPLHIVDGQLTPKMDGAVRGEAQLSRLPLGALLPPGDALSQVSGTLDGQLEVAGTLSKPTYDGHLAPRGVAFTATALAQPLTGVDGLIAFTNRHVQIVRFKAEDAGGTLSLSGRLDLADDGPLGFEANLDLRADDFPLRQQGQIAGEVDGRARIEAALAGREARVDVMLTNASVWLRGGDLRRGIDLRPHPDIVDPRQQALAPVARDVEEPLHLRLGLRSRNALWVRRDDFAVRASLDLTAESLGDRVRVRGPVSLDRGYLDLLGQTFELDGSSELRFVRSDPPNPAIAITATTENRRTGDEVTVSITGRADEPVVRFLIDDGAVTAGEAAQSLLGGASNDESAESQAESMVGSLIGGIMAVTARRELGGALPILMIDRNASEGTRVRAGFELDALVPGFLEDVIRGVYVEGIFSSGDGAGTGSDSQGTQGGVLVELFFPWDFVGSSQYGPGETWSVDLGWQP